MECLNKIKTNYDEQTMWCIKKSKKNANVSYSYNWWSFFMHFKNDRSYYIASYYLFLFIQVYAKNYLVNCQWNAIKVGSNFACTDI